MRELMPDAIFLLPGVGAQGADAAELGPALGTHPASILVPVSRGISGAPDPAAAAEAAPRRALVAQRWLSLERHSHAWATACEGP